MFGYAANVTDSQLDTLILLNLQRLLLCQELQLWKLAKGLADKHSIFCLNVERSTIATLVKGP